MMRKEITNYLEKNPYPKWKVLLLRVANSILLKYFKFRIRRIKLGSPSWHKLQEHLSHKSSVGIDSVKRNMFYQSTIKKCGEGLFVHPGVIICYPENIEIGSNVFINRGAFFTSPVDIKIGNNVLIGPYSMFNSGNHNYKSKGMLIREQGHSKGSIIIEDDVWIGGHVCVLPNVTIGKGAVVAANAVVTKSVPPYTVVGGIPAIEIGKRDDP